VISLAVLNELEEIDELAVRVITNMAEFKIPQWALDYPRSKHYFKDVVDGALYVYKENDKILGVMTLLPEDDPAYKTISGWIKDKSLVIHRVLVDPSAHKKGIAQKLFDFAVAKGIKDHYHSIKIDTHLENYKMRNFLGKNNFQDIGYLSCINRQAYEKVLEE
jgi:GNAT superfamily N-acetyltransferase